MSREYGYSQRQVEHTVLAKRVTKKEKKAILIVCVDSIMIARDDLKDTAKLKVKLKGEIQIKDLKALLVFFLKIKVAQNNKKYSSLNENIN